MFSSTSCERIINRGPRGASSLLPPGGGQGRISHLQSLEIREQDGALTQQGLNPPCLLREVFIEVTSQDMCKALSPLSAWGSLSSRQHWHYSEIASSGLKGLFPQPVLVLISRHPASQPRLGEGMMKVPSWQSWSQALALLLLP